MLGGISIHAPHEGERQFNPQRLWSGRLFQSTLPTRGSDTICGLQQPQVWNFNPRSPRGGATDIDKDTLFMAAEISIHAPHEGERPCGRTACARAHGNFNPRSPRGGATHRPEGTDNQAKDFNPRSPRGGATLCVNPQKTKNKISIHAPHEGERLNADLRGAKNNDISIHAPHEGERLFRGHVAVYTILAFQSTLPTRGSDPTVNIPCAQPFEISIHAPHEGERQSPSVASFIIAVKFQSTLPTRGSDYTLPTSVNIDGIISIHAPHEGERHTASTYLVHNKLFQSTLPTRGSD